MCNPLYKCITLVRQAKGSLIFVAVSVLPLSSFAQETWTLNRCIEYALSHNINIRQQEDNVKQQEISLNTSKNQCLPGVNAGAGESFNFGRALTIDNTYANQNTQSTSFNISANVPLYTGGQISNDIKIKKLNLQTSLAELDQARENITLNIISAYLEAICQRDLIAVSERQAALSQKQVERMENLCANGKVAEADVAQIRATHAQDAVSVIEQNNAYRLAILNLSQLLELESPEGMQLTYEEPDDITSVVIPSPDIIYSEALGIKPQVKASQLRIESAEKGIRLARSGYYPTVSLSGGVGTSYYKTNNFEAKSFGRQLKDNFSQYIGLNLSIPIFNRFNTRNQIRQAKLQLHTQQLQLEDTKKTLYKEIQQAYYNALASQKKCISTNVALESSRTSFDLMQRKYENGKANATEYEEARNKLINAEATALQSRYTFLFRQKIIDFYRTSNVR